MPLPLELGDVVKMRKLHPCGADLWTVTRVGADIKLKCHGCGRVVMLERAVFDKRVKKLISHASGEPDAEPLSG